MSVAKAFLDTNILLYLLSADTAKADRAEAVVAAGGTISVQVLNEFASVATRKLGMSVAEVRDVLTPIRTLCPVEPLTIAAHDEALNLMEHHSFSLYDALIVAAATLAGCDRLYSEDMHHGQTVNGRLTIQNPFADDFSLPA
jgi:predicted nucleic acid-binding protein